MLEVDRMDMGADLTTSARTIISALKDDRGSTAAEIAARAGVSRTTLHRISTGASDATVGTLREIALAAGLDLRVTTVPLSDPAASDAARLLLDDSVTADTKSLAADAAAWTVRLMRTAGTEPVDILIAAGHASAPLDREGSVLLRGEWDDLKLASAAISASGQWAISGAPALSRLGAPPGGPAILHVEDPAAVARLLSNTRPTRKVATDIALVPLAGTVMIDVLHDGPLTLVAPVQALLDAIGTGGQAESAAIAIARSW